MEGIVGLVSIVLPTYNRGYCIARTVDSIVSQSYQDWELIVVDNSSTDNTASILSRYRDDSRISVARVNNGGIIARSRNKGIELSKGSIVAFIDSDDPWLPSKLEKCVRRIECGNEFVYHGLYEITQRRLTSSKRLGLGRRLKEPVVKDLVVSGNAIATSSVVVSRELLSRCHGFNEDKDLVGIEDYDMWVRIACLTDDFYFIDEPLGFYTKGGGTLDDELRLKTLSSIKARHNSLHREYHGRTPAWLDLALARLLLTSDPCAGKAIISNVLKGKSVDFRSRLKALILLLLSSLALLKKQVLRYVG